MPEFETRLTEGTPLPALPSATKSIPAMGGRWKLMQPSSARQYALHGSRRMAAASRNVLSAQLCIL